MDPSGTIEIGARHTGYEKIDFFSSILTRRISANPCRTSKQTKPAAFWTFQEGTQSDEDFLITRYIPELDWHLVVRQDTGRLIAKLKWDMFCSSAIILLIIVSILIVITASSAPSNRQIISLTQSVEEEKRLIF